MPAPQPIPPGVEGHVKDYKGYSQRDLATARALLDRFGYRDRDGDGFRELPDGKPLVLRFATQPDQTSRQFDELWQRSLAPVGIKAEFLPQRWPDNYKAAQAGQLQLWFLGHSGDVADYYMLNFYGPSAGAGNLSRFRNAEFDALFLKSRRVADDAERVRLYAKMTEILAAYAPWCLHAYRVSNTLAAPWILGYRKNVHYFYPP